MKSLSLEDRFQFAMSPCNTRNPRAMASLLVLARSYAAREPQGFTATWPDEVPRSSEELKLLEDNYQVCVVAFRFSIFRAAPPPSRSKAHLLRRAPLMANTLEPPRALPGAVATSHAGSNAVGGCRFCRCGGGCR